MPVTAKIVNHPAKTWDQNKVSTSEKLLEESTPQHHRRCQRIVQSSFDGSDLQQTHVSASANGFVWAAFHAYSGHHQLVLRPEDIWFAILTQLSFFINAHAEELRSFFVAHDGREPLKAISEVEDYRYLAEQMAELIGKNVNDPELKDWVMPAFSTTTDEDRVVGAVLFMGAMQKYFSYYFAITCGIPSVTLLGEVCDWRVILKRLDKIDLLGDEPRQFAAMLRPIVRHLVLTFEEPTSDQVKHFWNTIVHKHELMSGEDFLSGWLTAFCFWSESGYAKEKSNMNIQLGDVAYPTIGITSVPAGLASVPVTVNNNGHVFSATMVAGSIGISARDAAASSSEAANRGDTPKKKASLRGGSMKLREEEKDKSEESNSESYCPVPPFGRPTELRTTRFQGRF